MQYRTLYTVCVKAAMDETLETYGDCGDNADYIYQLWHLSLAESGFLSHIQKAKIKYDT